MIDNLRSEKKYKKFELEFYDILLELSQTCTLKLCIPETFISNSLTSSITLLSTNYDTGELKVNQNISRKTFLDSICFFEDLVKMKSKFPIAVNKAKGIGGKDITKVLFSRRDCLETWNFFESQNRSHILQRYIPSNWNITIYRCILEGKKTLKKYLLRKTNKNIYEHPGIKKSMTSSNLTKFTQEIDESSYSIKRSDKVACTLIGQSSVLDAKMDQLIEIIESYYGDSFKVINLQADWIQDPKGNFFLINVKSYQIHNELSSLVIDRPIRVKKKRPKNNSLNDQKDFESSF